MVRNSIAVLVFVQNLRRAGLLWLEIALVACDTSQNHKSLSCMQQCHRSLQFVRMHERLFFIIAFGQVAAAAAAQQLQGDGTPPPPAPPPELQVGNVI